MTMKEIIHIKFQSDESSAKNRLLNSHFEVSFSGKTHSVEGFGNLYEYLLQTLTINPAIKVEIESLPINMMELFVWLKRALRGNFTIKATEIAHKNYGLNPLPKYFDLAQALGNETQLLDLFYGQLDLIEKSYDAYIILDLEHNPIYANARFFEIFGYSEKRFLKLKNFEQLQKAFGNYGDLYQQLITTLKANEPNLFYRSEAANFNISLSKYKTFIFDELIAIQFNDLSLEQALQSKYKEQKQEAHENLQMSLFDPLTGLGNRRYLDQEFNKVVKNSIRYNQNFLMVIFDLDNFKKVNDTYGHDVGDQVLVNLADTLKAKLRDTDVFSRMGGEEFVLIINAIDRNGATIVLDKLINAIREAQVPLEGGNKLKYTASIGCLLVDLKIPKEQEIDVSAIYNELYQQIDKLLYRAKENGKDQYILETYEISKK